MRIIQGDARERIGDGWVLRELRDGFLNDLMGGEAFLEGIEVFECLLISFVQNLLLLLSEEGDFVNRSGRRSKRGGGDGDPHLGELNRSFVEEERRRILHSHRELSACAFADCDDDVVLALALDRFDGLKDDLLLGLLREGIGAASIADDEGSERGVAVRRLLVDEEDLEERRFRRVAELAELLDHQTEGVFLIHQTFEERSFGETKNLTETGKSGVIISSCGRIRSRICSTRCRCRSC